MPTSDVSPTLASSWFGQPMVAATIAEEQAELIPHLTAQIGVRGLFLRPTAELPATLSGNMLRSLTRLHRVGNGWAGDLRCADEQLPLGNECFSLVYLLHVLEQSEDPQLLLRESARCLQPEGLLIALVFNPWSPFHGRWSRQPLRALGGGRVEQLLRQAGLAVESRFGVGCLWRSGRSLPGAAGERLRGVVAALRSSQALVARKRRSAPTLVGATTARLRVRATPS
jgi:SAM-dependent methyltransferase